MFAISDRRYRYRRVTIGDRKGAGFTMSYVAMRWAVPNDNTALHFIMFQIRARRIFIVFYVFSLYKENTKEALGKCRLRWVFGSERVQKKYIYI